MRPFVWLAFAPRSSIYDGVMTMCGLGHASPVWTLLLLITAHGICACFDMLVLTSLMQSEQPTYLGWSGPVGAGRLVRY